MTNPTPGHETCHHRIYFLSCDAYEALLARAAGRCEHCSIPAEAIYRGKLLIDHDSRIGWEAVRGLVCAKCNSHMRFVDRGLRPVDAQTFAYLDRSGLFVTPGYRGFCNWAGDSAAVRAELLAQLTASAGAGPGGRRARPRLACAPKAVRAPW